MSSKGEPGAQPGAQMTVEINDLSDLPGYELVSRGLADLAAGQGSVEAALVSIGSTRLSRLGLTVSQPLNEPEERLYQLLEAAYPPDAVHARYNALVRRLVNFERTLAGIQRADALEYRRVSNDGPV